MASKLPVNTVDVFGSRYKLQLRRCPADTSEDQGNCDTENRVIWVRDLPSIKVNLEHELVHAVADALGIELSEKITDQIATAINAVARANPRLARWLLED